MLKYHDLKGIYIINFKANMHEFIHISATSNQTQLNVLRLMSCQLEKTHSHVHNANCYVQSWEKEN
jgi:hypothetical protein